jgi:arsenate reductase
MPPCHAKHMSVTIYHNPRCAKSRETLRILESRGIRPEIIEYLKDPPSEASLRELIRLLGVAPRELVRSKEPEFKQAGLDDPSCTDADIIQALARFPKLIERPIVVKGRKAALGRPPGNVIKIL